MLDQAFAFRRTCPAENLCLLFFEAGCGEEEFLEFLAPAEREIGCFAEGVITRHFRRNGNEAVIALAARGFLPILFQPDYAEGATFDHHAWKSGEIAEDHCVQRVAIGRDRAGDEAPIIRVPEAIRKRT